MYQHPIPQNVTNYQFRLIGEMTIKQFLLLGLGAGIALLTYFSNLTGPIKWPIMLIAAAGGFALAFVPIEERPLDHWIRAFIKAVYRPTQFIWKKSPQPPDYLTYQPKVITNQESSLIISDHQKVAGLKTFIDTLPHQQASGLADQSENNRLDSINKIFENPLSQPNSLFTAPSQRDPIIQAPKPSPTKPKNSHKFTAVPTSAPISIDPTKTNNQSIAPHQDQTAPLPTIPQPQAYQKNLILKSKPQTTPFQETANTSSILPFPSTPTTPNTLVGMVLDATDKIIDNAIVEIHDQSDTPVRATKTNRLGQFFSVTPLKSGNYIISVEKEGHQFEPINIVLSNQIVSPIKINSK